MAPKYLYWANGSSTIARSKANGSNPKLDFITGASQPDGVSINATHLFWVNSGTSSIARASIDGSNVDPRFMPNARRPDDVVVSGGFIYGGE